MDFKEKSDFIKGMPKNFKEWYDGQQPKKRCDMIEGHDNYFEGRIEAIKEFLDEIEKNLENKYHKDWRMSPIIRDLFEDIKKILEK